jgi:hypothetical protein
MGKDKEKITPDTPPAQEPTREPTHEEDPWSPQSVDSMFDAQQIQTPPGEEYEPTTDTVGISEGIPRWICVIELKDESRSWLFFGRKKTKVVVLLDPDNTYRFVKYDPKIHGAGCDIPLMETTPVQLSQQLSGVDGTEMPYVQLFEKVRKQKGGLSTNALPTEQRPLAIKKPRIITK